MPAWHYRIGKTVSVLKVTAREDCTICTVKLSCGSEIECDLVIVAAGVKPNIYFVKVSFLKINSGVLTIDNMQTCLPNIFAAGDMTGSGIRPNAVMQSTVAAYNMPRMKKHLYDFFNAINSVNFLIFETFF